MSTPTPRTDAFVKQHHDEFPLWEWQDYASAYLDLARTLERELAAALAERDQWRECAEALFCDVAFECDNPKELEGYKRFDALKAQEAGR